MRVFGLMIIGVLLFISNTLNAQHSAPLWGPAGYTEGRYYYLPGVQSYYDIQLSEFIYNDNGTWIHRAHLPARHKNYNLYNGHKVVMTDYRGDTPYTYFNNHKKKYPKNYRGGKQKTIGENPDKGNSKSKSHQGNAQKKNL